MPIAHDSRGRPPALIVAGPTASGKSALAMALAERLNGVVINADSMQVYGELRILTARPTEQDEALVPHALYGVRPANEPGSVAWWRETAIEAMESARAAGRLPILTGGTGLYFASLTGGLAEIPDPGAAARSEARALLQEIGSTRLHDRLAQVDPETAARLRPSDGQRLARAWEVWRGTGRSLAAWQSSAPAPAPWRFAAILIDPPRAELRSAISGRLQQMLEQGAVEEVRSLMAMRLDPALPAARAHGVAELAAYLRGEHSLEQALALIALRSGQYTKRQATWFRHHKLADSHAQWTINARITDLEQFSERIDPGLWAFIESMG